MGFIGALLVKWGISGLWTRFRTWLKENRMLATGHILLAVVIIAGTLAVTLWVQRERTEGKLADATNKIGALQNRVQAIETVNSAQEATIGHLRELREADAKALAGLTTDFDELNLADTAYQKRLAELEKNNAAVRAYLDQPLPPELRSVVQKRTKP